MQTIAEPPQTLNADHTDIAANFVSLLPARPYCTDDVATGLLIRPKPKALAYRLIQPNRPGSVQCLPFDIDRRDAYFAAYDANLREPNAIAVNPDNGKAHLLYLLAHPVARTDAARLAPLQYLAAVERGMGRRLGADPHYNGLITKSPFSEAWRVEWRAPIPYTLDELADDLFSVDMRWAPKPDGFNGLSRNVSVFDDTRQWAYRAILRFKSDGRTWISGLPGAGKSRRRII